METTRAHGWEWTWEMLWREGSKVRCPLKIADTILFDDGRPDLWLFTAKDGLVKKRTRSRTTLEDIRRHLIAASSADPTNTRRYAAVLRRSSGRGEKLRAHVLDQPRCDAILREGADLTAAAALQAYVHARGGTATRYRCELVLDRSGRAVTRVHKLVYMGSHVGRGEAFLPPAARAEMQAAGAPDAQPAYVIKSSSAPLNSSASRATLALVRHLERMSRRTVLRFVADFVCNRREELCFIGSSECLTAPQPPAARRAGSARPGGRERAGSSGSLPLAEAGAEPRPPHGPRPATGPGASLVGAGKPSGGGCPGDFCGGFGGLAADGQARAPFAAAGGCGCSDACAPSVPPSTGARGEPEFLLTNKSILLARLEREAAAGPDAATRARLLAGTSRRLRPLGVYYRSVRVCAACYSAYVRLDSQRAQMAGLGSPGKDALGGARGPGARAGLDGGRHAGGAPCSSRAWAAQQVESFVAHVLPAAEEELGAGGGQRQARELAARLEAEAPGSERLRPSEDEAILAGMHQLRLLRAQSEGLTRAGATRAAPGEAPRQGGGAEGARGGESGLSGSLSAGEGDGQPLPQLLPPRPRAERPAALRVGMSAGRADMRIEPAARRAPSASAQRAQSLPGAADSVFRRAGSGSISLDEHTAIPYAVLSSAAHADQPPPPSAGPGAGPRARGRATEPPAAAPDVDLVVLPDFFESADSYEPLLLQLLQRARHAAAGVGGASEGEGGVQPRRPAARCVRVLLLNLPGQAFSSFPAEAATEPGGAHGRGSRPPGPLPPRFSNEYCAAALGTVLRALRERGAFGTAGVPLVLFGAGNGANVATLFALDCAASSELGLRSLLLCNPFAHLDHHLDVVLQNWLHGAQAGRALAGSDLHLFLFSHLLFSERYLERVSMNGALQALLQAPNPMTLEGRIAVCRGALAHRDLREGLAGLRVPAVLLQGSDDLLVRPSHAQPYLAAQGGTASTLAELAERGRGVAVVRVAGGHLLLQEAPGVLRRLLEAALDDDWAAVSLSDEPELVAAHAALL